MKSNTPWKLSAVVAAVALSACGGGGGGGSGETTAGTGTLRMAMTDAPACGWEHVYVTVEKVGVHTSASASDSDSGWQEIVLPTPKRIDLLTLTNGVLAELGQTTLPAGTYNQVRLVLAANTSANPLANAVQPEGGSEVALTTPSAQQSGLKLNANITVAANQMADVVLDFDACRSVVVRGNSGRYNLKPVISVVERLSTGIAGYVATSMPLVSTTVSVQQNGSVVRSTVPDASGRFELPFLNAGSYDVVVNAEGRSTAVLTGVPVATTSGMTVVNGTPTAILSPVSSMKDVTGTVVVSTVNGTSTSTAPVVDARVRALQALTGGPSVELADVAVDPDTANYRVRLPVASPVRSAYSGTTTMTFTTVSGTNTLEVSAPNRATFSRPLDLNTVTSPLNLSFGQ